MHFKLLACETFTREICACAADLPHVMDPEFTAIGSHDRPDELRTLLQERIDAVERSGRNYDAILLCYGLCGNAIAGLVARSVQLVVPRAHDCCAILLGSKKAFKQHFEKCPSQAFLSRGHIERNAGEHIHQLWIKDLEDQKAVLTRLYGAENAEALAAVLNPPGTDKLVYVNIKPTENKECIQQCREKAEKEHKQYVQLEGSLALIRNLLSGNWYAEDFLTVKPGKKIMGIYDWDKIIGAA